MECERAVPSANAVILVPGPQHPESRTQVTAQSREEKREREGAGRSTHIKNHHIAGLEVKLEAVTARGDIGDDALHSLGGGDL